MTSDPILMARVKTFPNVTVRVDASPAVALRSIAVELDSDHVVASGSSSSVHGGDNTVALTAFEANVVGDVSVSATLLYGASDPHNGYGPNRFRRLAARFHVRANVFLPE